MLCFHLLNITKAKEMTVNMVEPAQQLLFMCTKQAFKTLMMHISNKYTSCDTCTLMLFITGVTYAHPIS